MIKKKKKNSLEILIWKILQTCTYQLEYYTFIRKPQNYCTPPIFFSPNRSEISSSFPTSTELRVCIANIRGSLIEKAPGTWGHKNSTSNIPHGKYKFPGKLFRQREIPREHVEVDKKKFDEHMLSQKRAFILIFAGNMGDIHTHRLNYPEFMFAYMCRKFSLNVKWRNLFVER